MRLEIDLPEGATLIGGTRKTEIGQLEGRSNKLEVSTLWAASPTDNRGKAEWVVNAPAGSQLTVRAMSERGGTIRRDVTLE